MKGQSPQIERSRRLVEDSRRLVTHSETARGDLKAANDQAAYLRAQAAFMRFMHYNENAAEFFAHLDKRSLED